MDTILDCCCGIDVHRDIVEACILHGDANTPDAIRGSFETTQTGLSALVVWLFEHDCYQVAMESTGVYWYPVYEAIEEQSKYCERIMVVNAQHMRNLPGRKSDVRDAEWIATLMRHGLLEASFIPERDIRDLREYSRFHKTLVEEKNRHVNRLEKFLQTHGFKFSSVMSDITCVSGRKLLNRLAQSGEITKQDAFSACGRLKAEPEKVAKAVCGKINGFEKKLLRLILKQLDDKEADIRAILAEMEELAEPFQKKTEILRTVPGIDKVSSLVIIGEIGAHPQDSFDSPEKLCSWAGLSPRNDESAGKVKSRKILHGDPYIKSILCQVAWASVKSRKSIFHWWFWSHQGKIGKKKAIIAVARKILCLIYHLFLTDEPYDLNLVRSPAA